MLVFGREYTPMFRSGMDNFDKSSYLGTWYEESNLFEVYDFAASCIRATYTDQGDNVGVLNEAMNAVYVSCAYC